MIYYLAFGPIFYRMPKGRSDDSLGYGYLLDPGEICSSYKSQSICKGDEVCEKAVYDRQTCISSLNSWLDRVNSTCKDQINHLEECVETDQACRAELHAFLRCESISDRPVWVADETLAHIERLKGPMIAKASK